MTWPRRNARLIQDRAEPQRASLSLQSGHSTLPRPLCDSCIERSHQRPSKRSFCCFIFLVETGSPVSHTGLDFAHASILGAGYLAWLPEVFLEVWLSVPNCSHLLYGPDPTLDHSAGSSDKVKSSDPLKLAPALKILL